MQARLEHFLKKRDFAKLQFAAFSEDYDKKQFCIRHAQRIATLGTIIGAILGGLSLSETRGAFVIGIVGVAILAITAAVQLEFVSPYQIEEAAEFHRISRELAVIVDKFDNVYNQIHVNDWEETCADMEQANREYTSLMRGARNASFESYLRGKMKTNPPTEEDIATTMGGFLDKRCQCSKKPKRYDEMKARWNNNIQNHRSDVAQNLANQLAQVQEGKNLTMEG